MPLGNPPPNSGPQKTMEKIGLSLICTFVSIFLCFILLEVGVRIFVDNGMHFDLEMWKYAKQLKTDAKNLRVGHRHRPNTSAHLMGVDIKINSKGLRDREYDYSKKAGVKRILMLGDSLVFGWGVEQSKTSSKQLEVLLNQERHPPQKQGVSYQVINAGIGNYNTDMEIASFFDEGNNFQPDVVILNYFINDAEPTPRNKGTVLKDISYLTIYTLGRIDAFRRMHLGAKDWRSYYLDLYRENSAGWRKTVAAIKELAAYCHGKGIKLIIVNYPELHVLKEYPFRRVNYLIEFLADKIDVAYFDLLPTLQHYEPESLWVSKDDLHPNEFANKIIAKAIYNFLLANKTL